MIAYFQKSISLTEKSRGFHLVTSEILAQLPELAAVEQDLLHLFLQHSSASLTINENADPDVRGDMERFLLQSVPENAAIFRHTLEGPDDMPAHIKSSLIGCSLSIPVCRGELLLGTWQGIWLGEHREQGGERQIIASC